jgi:hypothetical protein
MQSSFVKHSTYVRSQNLRSRSRPTLRLHRGLKRRGRTGSWRISRSFVCGQNLPNLRAHSRTFSPDNSQTSPAVLSGADGWVHGVDEDRGHAVAVGETDNSLTSRESLSTEPYHN